MGVELSCESVFNETVKLGGGIVVEVNRRHLWSLNAGVIGADA